MVEKQEKIRSFLRNQGIRTPDKMRSYISDRDGTPYPKRDMFPHLKRYADEFLNGSTQHRLLILLGLRGTGKTTLFAQVFSELTSVPNKLFISLDEIRTLGLTLTEVLQVYEQEVLGTFFESLTEPVFLFLDEVQYDDGWALCLKTLYDRTDKVCVLATGSSALALQGRHIGADIARRARYEHLFPMNFAEYLRIRHRKAEPRELSADICRAFAEADGADALFGRLRSLAPRVNRHLAAVSTLEVMAYLKHGSLPFVLSEGREQDIYRRIQRVVDKVVRDDAAFIGGFETGTIAKIPDLLYAISNSDTVVASNVSKHLGITRPVVAEVLRTLERTETLLRILPYGSVSSQVRRPSKYTFMSPAVRATLFNTFGSVSGEEEYKGRLLEDAVALCLHRVFVSEKGWSLTYDSSRGGADFIVSRGDSAIVIEAGFGDKGTRQVEHTMRSVSRDSFGVVLSPAPLRMNGAVVHVPIEVFLLM